MSKTVHFLINQDGTAHKGEDVVVANNNILGFSNDGVVVAKTPDMVKSDLGLIVGSTFTSDVTIGSINEGADISINTSYIDIISAMLTKVYNPTYVAPTLSLSWPGNKTVEIGEAFQQVSAVFNPGRINGVYNGTTKVWEPSTKQADRAGAATEYIIGTYTGSLNYNTPSGFVAAGDNIITGSVIHNAGSTPLNSKGLSTGLSALPGGALNPVTATSITIVGTRKLFYGTRTLTPVLDSAKVRLLPHNSLNPQKGTTFVIDIEPGDVDVVIAYPESIYTEGPISSIIHFSSNMDVQQAFDKTQTVTVQGATSGVAYEAEYRIYKYTPLSPFTQATRYTVTL